MSAKKLCSKCATGEKELILDPHSAICPYAYCYKKHSCAYYKPLSLSRRLELFINRIKKQ